MSTESAGRMTRRERRNYATSVSGENKMSENTKLELVDKQGKTRGKGARDITYKVLNRVPTSIEEFTSVTGVKDEKEFCEFLYVGYNESNYSAASDEIGEYIPDSWDKETSAQFRLAVRNTAKLTNLPVEAVVAMIKPAIEKALIEKAEAEAKAKAEAEANQAKTA